MNDSRFVNQHNSFNFADIYEIAFTFRLRQYPDEIHKKVIKALVSHLRYESYTLESIYFSLWHLCSYGYFDIVDEILETPMLFEATFNDHVPYHTLMISFVFYDLFHGGFHDSANKLLKQFPPVLEFLKTAKKYSELSAPEVSESFLIPRILQSFSIETIPRILQWYEEVSESFLIPRILQWDVGVDINEKNILRIRHEFHHDYIRPKILKAHSNRLVLVRLIFHFHEIMKDYRLSLTLSRLVFPYLPFYEQCEVDFIKTCYQS